MVRCCMAFVVKCQFYLFTGSSTLLILLLLWFYETAQHRWNSDGAKIGCGFSSNIWCQTLKRKKQNKWNVRTFKCNRSKHITSCSRCIMLWNLYFWIEWRNYWNLKYFFKSHQNAIDWGWKVFEKRLLLVIAIQSVRLEEVSSKNSHSILGALSQV